MLLRFRISRFMGWGEECNFLPPVEGRCKIPLPEDVSVVDTEYGKMLKMKKRKCFSYDSVVMLNAMLRKCPCQRCG
ncbi:hypothetical protein [Archaeoglobus sp.]